MAQGTPAALGVGVDEDSGTTTHTYTLPAGGAADVRVYLAIGWVSPGTSATSISSLTDSTGRTWSRLGGASGAATTNGTYIGVDLWGHYLSGAHPGGTMTVTHNANVFGTNFSSWTQSGMADASAVDGTPVGQTWDTGATDTAMTTPALSTGNANDTLYAFGMADGPAVGAGGPTATAGTDWTELNESHSDAHDFALVTFYRLVTSTGSYSGAATWSNAPQFGEQTLLVAVKEAGGSVWPPVDNPAAPPLRIARSNLRLG